VADVRVRFIGDAASLRSFYAQLGNETRVAGQEIKRAGEKALSGLFGDNPNVQMSGVRTTIDGVNKTFRALGDAVLTVDRRVADIDWRGVAGGEKNFRSTLKAVQDFERAARSGIVATDEQTEAYRQQKVQLQALTTQMMANTRVSTLKQPVGILGQAQTVFGNEPFYEIAKQNLSRLKQTLGEIVQVLPGVNLKALTASMREPLKLAEESLRNMGLMVDTNGRLRTTQGRFASVADPTVASLREEVRWRRQNIGVIETEAKALTQRRIAASAQGRVALGQAQQAVSQSFDMLPPIPSTFGQLLAADKKGQLLKLMGRSGFGIGQNIGELSKSIDASDIHVVDDLVRGVTRVSGSFTDVSGRTKEFSAELDKNGNIVTRFGGQLRGLRQFLAQTGRDFQKVVEWTIATTVVFASLRLVMQGLGIIKEFDTLLARFGITAQLTTEQARQYFGEFAQIATNTATPLREMLTVADDIALGTRKAGQTTEQWKAQMLDLANAVGIYTNLTGQDATKATDILISSMKQLGLTASDVVGVLNKVTAVAGGQAGAISDISQGLAVMAEAGKQAGLSVDQQIATIQVLSQVTAKTPAEVATAFKNLVGALDNPAAIKALDKYNISLKDQEGNLRNIIDIYGEINQKIRQGVIPASDVKGLLRAISGGPRRLPDAAALLSNIDSVNDVTQKSISATNEALVANAKVLDTLNAKWIQLQNLLQKNLFGSFGSQFRSLAEAGIDALTAITNLTSQFSSAIVVILKFVAVLALVKGGLAIFKAISGTFGNMAFALSGGYVAMQENVKRLVAMTEAQRAYAATTRTTTGITWQNTFAIQEQVVAMEKAAITQATFSQRMKDWGKAAKGAFAGVAAGAAAGAVMGGLATGGDIRGIAGGGLMAGGLGLMQIPSPYGISQIAGLSMMVGGFALTQLTGDQQKAADATKMQVEELTNLIKQYEEAGAIYSNASKANKELEKTIGDLNSKTNKSAAELEQLKEFQRTYTSNVLEMADATRQLDDAQAKILESTGQVGSRITKPLLEAGRLTTASMQQLKREVYSGLFGISDQPIRGTIPWGTTGRGALATAGSSIARSLAPDKIVVGSTGETQAFYKEINLAKLNAESVKELFDELGNLKFNIPINAENLKNIDKALQSIKGTVPDEVFNRMELSLYAAAGAGSQLYATLFQIDNAIAELQTRSILALINPDDAANAEKVLNAMKNIIPQLETNTNMLGQSLGTSGWQGASTVGQTRLDELSKLTAQIMYGDLSKEQLTTVFERVAEITNELTGQASKWDDINYRLAFMSNLAELFGLKGKLAFDDVTVSARDFTEELEAMTGALEKARDSFLGSLAEKSASLQADILGGQFKDKPGEQAFLQGQLQAAFDAIDAYNAVIASLENLKDRAAEAKINFENLSQGIISDFGASLAKIPGLEDAASLSLDQLMTRLLELGFRMGLSREQMGKLIEKIAELPKLIKDIGDLKLRFGIVGDLSEAINSFKLLSNATARLAKIFPQWQGMADMFAGIVSDLQEGQNRINTWASDIGGYYAGGRGNVATGSSSAAARQAGMLEIPDEFREMNRPVIDLVKEAVANAKLIQSQIPGEAKRNKDQIVAIFDGVKKILQTKGIGEEYLRKAMQDLTDEIKKQNELLAKADTMRRIRVGAGDFAALANVPINAKSGISLGSPEGPITISLNVTGQILTPAQIQQLAEFLGAALGRHIGG
jgi:TP901 family phage tail tape measure protein